MPTGTKAIGKGLGVFGNSCGVIVLGLTRTVCVGTPEGVRSVMLPVGSSRRPNVHAGMLIVILIGGGMVLRSDTPANDAACFAALSRV